MVIPFPQRFQLSITSLYPHRLYFQQTTLTECVDLESIKRKYQLKEEKYYIQ